MKMDKPHMKKVYIFIVVVFTLFICFPNISSEENTTEEKLYVWEQKDVTYRTFDKYNVKTTVKAYWVISNEDDFNNSVGTIKRAMVRLDDMIPPSIDAVLLTHKKKELYDQKMPDGSQKVLKGEHTEKILNLFQKWITKFGMKVVDLKITLDNV